MIAYNICDLPIDPSKDFKLGFSVWARKPPKNYLSVYPRTVQEIKKETGSENLSLYALVDDIWPKVVFARSSEEQQEISDGYLKLLGLGFQRVLFVSDFVEETILETFFSGALKLTVSEFWKLLPQSKKRVSKELTFVELLGFFWHVHVLKTAFDKFGITGLLVGIRSEFFYLTSRKLLPPHNLYFVDTK